MVFLKADILEAGYPNGFTIRDISFTLDQGEVLVVTGRSGSGKTTLVRVLANSISRVGGYWLGKIELLGRDISRMSAREFVSLVSYIPQEPWYGIIGYTIESEFCYTSLLKNRICETRMLERVGFGKKGDFVTYGLSAGESQLLLWAEVLALNSRLVLMDEPFVYLDVENRGKLIDYVRKMVEEGRSVIVVDHDPISWSSLDPIVIVLDGGRVLYRGRLEGMDFQMPMLGLNINKGSDSVVEANNIWFRYPGYDWVIKSSSFSIEEGDFVVVSGRNGSGKTTLLKIIAGLLKPSRGRLKVSRNPIYIPENPLSYFSMPTPLDELRYMARGDDNRVEEVVEIFGLKNILGSKLSKLSSGERRRLAIASAYLGGFDIYLLDEPTGGLDYYNVAKVFDVIQRLLDDRKTVIAASHDPRVRKVAGTHLTIDGGVVKRV
ncbi:ATP-binding cassette domain-containing protein [Thermogladius sp. 4427co]|uniref:ATP-binding cassette domain-containing protein n=1 Tax=Thermogladius sp. 4427co TaxID=3450718 RepID=UPI003F7944F2